MLGPRDYLKKLRKTEDMILGDIPSEVLNILIDIPFYREIYKEILQKGKNSNRDEFFNRLFQDLISKMGTIRTREIVVGELLLREVNACVINLEKETKGEYSGYIIVLNRGLFLLFYSLTKLILARSATFPDLDLEEIYPHLETIISSDKAESLIKRVINDYLKGGIPQLAPGEVIIHDERLNLFGILYIYSVMFIISHELAHLLLHDLDDTPNESKEFEADEAGFIILLNYIYEKGDDSELMKAIASTEITLHYFELIEKIGTFKSTTHPSAEKRISRLRERFEFPRIYYDLPNSMITLSREILEKIK